MSSLLPVELKEILVFTLDEPRYALTLPAVERVVQAVEITPLPKAPSFVLGVINVQGQVIPVVDIRQRFGLAPREVGLDDLFILARTPRRRVALVADAVVGIHELAEREFVAPEKVLPGAGYIRGLAKLKDNLVLIYDLDQFLSLDEELSLDAALAENTAGGTA